MDHISPVQGWDRISQRNNSGARRSMGRVGRKSSALMEELESRMLLTAVGPAAQLFIGLQPSNGFVKLFNGFALEVEVQDSSGNIVTTDTSTLTISIASGPGHLIGTKTAKAVAGVADFTHFSFSQVGNYTLTVSDGALTGATSNTIGIVAAPKATTLEFVQEPTDNAVGATITSPVTVKVLDQYGNSFIRPGQVQLKLLSGPSKGKVSGTLHAKTIAGVATFTSVSVNEGGSFELQAKDGSLTVNSNSFNMGGPPVATTLVFDQQPSDATAGVAVAPPITVEVDDQYGHLMSSDHSSVKLAVATGPATNLIHICAAKIEEQWVDVATFTKVVHWMPPGLIR